MLESDATVRGSPSLIRLEAAHPPSLSIATEGPGQGWILLRSGLDFTKLDASLFQRDYLKTATILRKIPLLLSFF